MFRSFIAVFLVHFFLCVGISAVESSVPSHGPQLQGMAEYSGPLQGHKAPLATSDADDHVLLDDRLDLPDLVQARSVEPASVPNPVASVGFVVAQMPSAIVAPLRRPPRALTTVA